MRSSQSWARSAGPQSQVFFNDVMQIVPLSWPAAIVSGKSSEQPFATWRRR
ncbi:hypothetical protein ACFY5C_19655 [Streptomyces sp. NPDC012935]|uniref:hypothetical protein n=1 Tax=Streptomyces sp. NPDC012935 TaxID=3364857 RepID=UPI0036CD8F4F